MPFWQNEAKLSWAKIGRGSRVIDENGGGPGVRLRKAAKGKSRK